MSLRASLLIAAHNEGPALRRTIQSVLAAAAGLDAELIVADDASTDGAPEDVAHEFSRVKLVRHATRRGASPTKHLAATHAQGEVLVFLDGHTNPEPTALRRLIEDVELTNGDAIITPAVPQLDVATWTNSRTQIGHGYALSLHDLGCRWVPQSSLRTHPVGGRTFYESPALIGCALAVSRRVYDQLWGFDPHMRSWGVEDLDFGLKAWLTGHPILHDPAAVVGHRFRKSFDNFTVPTEHLWANQLRMARKHFTEATWSAWVQQFRKQHEKCGCQSAGNSSPEARLNLLEHPEGPWARAWETFLADRASVEQERAYLLSQRRHDEFWFAQRFGLDWPTVVPVVRPIKPAVEGPSAHNSSKIRNGTTSPTRAEAAIVSPNESSPSPNPSSAPEPSPSPLPSPEPSPTPPPDDTSCHISLVGGFGVGWEGGDLDFYISATSTAGEISVYSVDVNDDDTIDGSAGHDPRIDGALITGLSGDLLRSPTEDGEYVSRVRITDIADNSCDFMIPVYVGNVPPAIEIFAETQGETTENFEMNVTISEPGDDSAQSLSIAWGDGTTSTLPPSGGTATHRYAVDGEYTATVTVIDEDGTWSREHALNIGDQNAPPPPETFPQIVNASATIDPSSQAAMLTIVAVDAGGNPVPQIRWDLSGGDLFLDGTGPTIVIPPDNESTLPYIASVQFTDGSGNTAEALFAFAAAGSPEKKATVNNYEDLFRIATPDLPAANPDDGSEGWRVHHTKQRRLASRYQRELGINVHENQYLRGVPKNVHDEIGGAQIAWWRRKAEVYNIPLFPNSAFSRVYDVVPLGEIEAFEQLLEQEYSIWWIEQGRNQKSTVKKIKNSISSGRGRFVTGKASRWQRLGFTITAFGIFTLVSDSAFACMNIANHTPQQLSAWNRFESVYLQTLEKATNNRFLRRADAWNLKDSFIAYGRALNLNSDALEKVDALLLKQILTSSELID